MNKKLLKVLAGQAEGPPPLWLMRQAGRYLPEYREIRATAESFLNFCYTPRLAVEATLQPIRRFGFDAAILFSDILVVPDALGQKVSFETGEGPRLEAISDRAGFDRLRSELDFDKLQPVFDTISELTTKLPPEVTLIGFCGAPWTVATYMIAGRGTPDQAPARLFAYRHPELFAQLIDRLVEVSSAYLIRQFRAGVQAVQIFDSWAGVLPAGEFERWSLDPIAAMVAKVRAAVPEAPIIAFPRQAGSRLIKFTQIPGLSGVGLDTAVDPTWAAEHVQARLPVQGNLDPLALLAGGPALDDAIDRILAAFDGRPHIFNLGHGILPETPVAHVERLVARVRGKAST
jgi:uroporphyrinogen decarboxylase